jgi:hypothetical protein
MLEVLGLKILEKGITEGLKRNCVRLEKGVKRGADLLLAHFRAA